MLYCAMNDNNVRFTTNLCLSIYVGPLAVPGSPPPRGGMVWSSLPLAVPGGPPLRGGMVWSGFSLLCCELLFNQPLAPWPFGPSLAHSPTHMGGETQPSPPGWGDGLARTIYPRGGGRPATGPA